MTQAMHADMQAMADKFGVDRGALVCLLSYLKERLSKPEMAAAFAAATPEQQDQILKAGVKAWHEQSTAALAELAEGRSEWAQAARQQIAEDVWNQARAKGVAA